MVVALSSKYAHKELKAKKEEFEKFFSTGTSRNKKKTNLPEDNHLTGWDAETEQELGFIESTSPKNQRKKDDSLTIEDLSFFYDKPL